MLRFTQIACTFIVVLLAGSTVASAQDETPQPGARLDELQQRLKLSDEQRDKIRPILEEEAAKLKDIRAKYEGDTSRRSRRKMLRELQDVQQRIQKRIEPILTKEQRTEWAKIRQERRSELRQRQRSGTQ